MVTHSLLAILFACTSSPPSQGKNPRAESDEPTVLEPAPVVDSDTGAPSDSATGSDTGAIDEVRVTDLASGSGYIDDWFGGFKRGRGAIVHDYDLDGRFDVFAGNPTNESYILRIVTSSQGLAFEPMQILSDDGFIWGGAAADYDSDGDIDLYLAVGGNDTAGLDMLMRNDLGEVGVDPAAPFVDATRDVGGLTPRAPSGDVLLTGTAGTIWFDADNDGRLDLLTSNDVDKEDIGQISPRNGRGRNQLWLNQANGRFVDVAVVAGLTEQRSTRNSSVLDFDGDGDIDVFENNYIGPNILWRNELQETGQLSFTDVTQESSLGGGDLSFPLDGESMCSIAADLDNDGWEDLVIFRRGQKSTPLEPEVHDNGYMLWMNVEGTGFVEVAEHTNLNDNFAALPKSDGVMGCQIGDLNADGFPDLFMGNGGGQGGAPNYLFLSTERTEVEIKGVGTVTVPHFEDRSDLIDFPSVGAKAAYPYRTHGTAVVDYDGDGLPELAVHNGGPGFWGPDEEMEEPNRLFDFELPGEPSWLRVQLHGDGVAVNTDGIGARVRLTVEGDNGETWQLHQVRKAGSGFGAQNEPVLFFGLDGATAVSQVEVTWPDGVVQEVVPKGLNEVLEVVR